MGKGYYIVGVVLLGVSAFLLFDRIKKGNLKLNIFNENVIENENHLQPPMEVPSLATPGFVQKLK